MAGTGFALMKMIGAFGSFLGPSLVGVLSDASGGSYTPAILVLTVFLLTAVAMQLLFQEPGEQHQTVSSSASMCCILGSFAKANKNC